MALEEWCLSSGDQISEQIIQTSSEPTNWPTPDMDAYSPCDPASRHRLLFKGPRLLLSRRKLRWSISLAILWRHSPNQYRRDIPRTGSLEEGAGVLSGLDGSVPRIGGDSCSDNG